MREPVDPPIGNTKRKRVSSRTKAIAVVVFLPIPYLAVAGLVCAIWHKRLAAGVTQGDWFDWCMPDGMFFGFVLAALLVVSCLFLIPLILSLIGDWRRYRASKS